MPSHYSDMGFSVAGANDLKRIMKELPEAACKIETSEGYYNYCVADGCIEFWVHYNTDDEMMSLDFHYNNNHAVPVRMVRWLEYAEQMQSSTIKVSYPREETLFPIIADVANADMHREIMRGDDLMLQVSCFAETMSLLYASDTGYTKENCFVPAGSFEDNGTTSVPANAMICGTVIDHKKCQNSIDGGLYYVITIRCHDALLDVIADAEFVTKEPIKGSIVKGTFWLSGKIMR